MGTWGLGRGQGGVVGVLELGIDISIGDYPIWRLDDEEDASGD